MAEFARDLYFGAENFKFGKLKTISKIVVKRFFVENVFKELNCKMCMLSINVFLFHKHYNGVIIIHKRLLHEILMLFNIMYRCFAFYVDNSKYI